MNEVNRRAVRRARLASDNAMPGFEPRAGSAEWCPAMDAVETEAEYRFLFDVPGLTRKDLQVHVDGEVLSLTGARTTWPRQEKVLRIERPTGAFVWRVALPADTPVERTDATLRDGVLQLRVPKRRSPFLARGGQEQDLERHAPGDN